MNNSLLLLLGWLILMLSRPCSPQQTASRPPAQTPAPDPPSSSSPTSSPLPSFTADPCINGVCQVAARNKATCVVLERTSTCKAFKNLYVPVNLRAYFKEKFPAKKPESIPETVVDGLGFDKIYASEPYSYPTRYIADYMRARAGCSMPNQTYYRTSYCMDLLDFFTNVSPHACTQSSTKPSICGSTLDSRADSIDKDKSNPEACPIGDAGRELAEAYARSLRTHPWRSTSLNTTDCISGVENEKDGTVDLCGYTNESVACNNKCASVSAQKCAQASSSQVTALSQPATCDENDIAACGGGLNVGLIILIVGASLVVVGLAALFFTRRRADPEALNKPDPMTLPRVHDTATRVGGVPSGTQLPAAPMVHSMPEPGPVKQALYPPQPQASIAPLQPMCTGVEPTEATVTTVRGQFPGLQDGELNLQPGDYVTVHNRFADGWALGTRHTTSDGREPETGYFPSGYLVEATVPHHPSRSDSIRRRG